MADPAIVLAVASVLIAAALVLVTYYLVQQTKALASATEGLKELERRRARTEARRIQITRVRRKMELVQTILGWDFKRWTDSYLTRGAYPRPEGDFIRELATLLEYGKDHANRELVGGLIRVLDMLIQDVKIDRIPADNFVGNLEHLRELREDIPRWETELMALSVEETATIVEDSR